MSNNIIDINRKIEELIENAIAGDNSKAVKIIEPNNLKDAVKRLTQLQNVLDIKMKEITELKNYIDAIVYNNVFHMFDTPNGSQK